MKNSTLIVRSAGIIILLSGIAHFFSSINDKENNYAPDYIIGHWKVDYGDKNVEGSILYEIKKENDNFNAYTRIYLDTQGNSSQAYGNKTLTISSFDEHKGEGIYTVEYEGENYELECQIDMIDSNTFKLSYYDSDKVNTETWKKEQL